METDARSLRARHRRELLRTGRAWPAPNGMFYAIQKFLDRLPWGTSHVDYARIEAATPLQRDHADAQAQADWLRGTRLARHPRVGVYWGIFDPVIVVDTEYALRSLDWLSSHHPMGLFLFGLSNEQGKWAPRFEDWLQFDGGSRIIAIR